MVDLELTRRNALETDNYYGKPESFFVFIVGVNDEWQEGRTEYGDTALYNEYLAAGVPPGQVVFVKDQKATKSNCEVELKELLKLATPSSTLVFYYGGHGSPTGLNTHEQEWQQKDIVSLIDSLFCGDRVVMLVDCCASGNFCRWIQPPHLVRHSYVCLMSTAPYTEAGAAWTMTTCWNNALQCSDGTLQLCLVIDFMSDSTAGIKGDLFTVYLGKGVNSESCTWLPQRPNQSTRRQLSWPRLEHHIPPDGRMSDTCLVGDRVYYKHSGGPYKVGAEYIPPVWLAATIQTKCGGEDVQLQVTDSISQLQWNVQVSYKQILNELHMASTYMIPEKFFEVQCKLATNFKYIDYSFTPATIVRAVGEDGNIHEANVVDSRDVDWDAYLAADNCIGSPPYGPHVVVCWSQNNATSVISLERINMPASSGTPFVSSLKTEEDGETAKERKALIASIESCGKTVCDARQVLGGTSKLTCFWPEDGEWYDAEALDPSSVSLGVLASHVMFTGPGPYCPVHYEDDELYLIPLRYVEKRVVCPWFFRCC
jgi:hypothetical protein